uniref:Uncharacterized protein n=1 Tax=Arundo donax TaxID=35708 RepID=A0A0A9GL25_ARUDO
MARQGSVRKPSSIFHRQFWEPSGRDIALASVRGLQYVSKGSTAPTTTKDSTAAAPTEASARSTETPRQPPTIDVPQPSAAVGEEASESFLQDLANTSQ